MRSARFLGLLLVTGLLLACSADLPGTVLPQGEVAVPVPTSIATPTAHRPPIDKPTPPTRTTAPSPSRTLTATPSPTPTPTPTSGPPPLLAPSSGRSLPLSARLLLSADGHLTAGMSSFDSGEERFILAALDRSVHSITPAGQVEWKARSPGPVYALAALGAGRAAAGDDAGHVILLDSEGRRIWAYSLGSRVTAIQGLWHGGILAGGWDEKLTFLELDETGGQVRWQAELGSAVTGIAVLRDLALASTLDGSVQAFDLSGARVWRYDTGVPVAGLSASGARVGGSLVGEQILVGCQDGRLVSLAPDGTLRWSRAVGTGSPVWTVTDSGEGQGAILVGTGGVEPRLSLLTSDGEWLWRSVAPSAVGAVAVADLDGDGDVEILAGQADGEVTAYDRLGRRRGSAQVGLPVWHLEVAGTPGDEAVLVLAGVSAWRLVPESGPAVKARLAPPAMLQGQALPVPTATAGQADAQEAVLLFVGDVALGRSVEMQLLREGAGYPWVGLAPLLHEADLVVGNLEGVLTTQGQPMNKAYVIRAHPYWARSLVEAGFDLVTVANNHALDYGDPGLDETLESLGAMDIAVVGAGNAQAEARRPALFELNGIRIAVLGYAGVYWRGSDDMPASDRIAWGDPQAVQADVEAVRGRADVVVVVLHAGQEYARQPSGSQVAVAHAAIDGGADLVVGHHPHVTQTVERYRGGLIVYSLGDALFDIPIQAAMQGDLLLVRVTREGLVRAELLPFWIDAEVQPRLLDDGTGTARIEPIYP